MNAKEANQIPICSYLDRFGIKPSKILLLYISPYRIENNPSFKVNLDKNIWVDYGDGNAGGTLIDLVLKINPTFGISDAINQISRMSGPCFSFHQQNTLPNLPDHNEHSNICNNKIKPLGNNRAITDYLNSRGISLNTMHKYEYISVLS